MAEVQTTTEAGEMTKLFVEFVMMQTQNTAHCLGQMPDPRTGQAYVNIPMARLLIDQLMMIRAKTAGNLSDEEKKIIDSAVEEMDQAFHYVAARTEGFHPGESLAYDEPVPPVASTPEPAAPTSEPAPAKPAAEPAATPPPEENRKRFTKSYGA